MRMLPRIGRALAMLGACGAVLVASAGVAGAAAGTTHYREIEHNGTDTIYDVAPCNDDLGGFEIDLVYNSQFHDTQNANGDWFTGTETGTFSAHPIEFTIGEDEDGNPIIVPVLDGDGNTIPREGETFTGKFTTWFGGSVNLQGSVFTDTFNVRGVGSEGSTFRAHNVNHTVFGPGEPFDPNTLVKLDFHKASCG